MKLEVGYNDSFKVRCEQYDTSTSCSFSILYISDFHFNKYSEGIVLKMIRKINELNPDIILLGGDYTDSKRGLEYFNIFLQSLLHRKNVFAIAGNHDYFFGLEAIIKVITANKVKWIENTSFIFEINNSRVQIDGSKAVKEKSDVDFSILCLHKPVDISEFSNNYNVAFGGHLHGCQFVLWQNEKGLYPGKLFYKWNILTQRFNNCHYFISKGMGDTLPVRYNCAKDMIFVNVAGNNKHT